MWHLVDFLACWMLLGPEARHRVYRELIRSRQPRVWHFEVGDILIIGA